MSEISIPNGVPELMDDRIVRGVWDYHDASGTVIGHVIRWEGLDGSKEIRPFFRCGPNGNWRQGGTPDRAPLYELPRLLENPTAVVIVAEGEKCVWSVMEKTRGLATTSLGGANRASRADWQPLAGREVLVWPDADEPGWSYAQDVVGILAQLEPRPRVSVVDVNALGLPEGGDVADWLDSHPSAGFEDILGLPRLTEEAVERMRESVPPAVLADARRDHSKEVTMSRSVPDIDHIVHAATILARANRRRLGALSGCTTAQARKLLQGCIFTRLGAPARVVFRGGEIAIQDATKDEVEAWLTREVAWINEDEDDDGFITRTYCTTPPWAVRYLTSCPPEGIQEICVVTQTPFFNRDGRLVQRTGVTGAEENDLMTVLVVPKDLERMPEISERPNKAEIDAAKALIIDELLVDFPLTQSGRAHAIALLLLPFVRQMIDGPTPLHLVHAATPGSGKSLLVTVLSMIATGEHGSLLSLPDDEAEVRKVITTQLLAGAQTIIFDNLSERRTIRSPALSKALTASRYGDRLLGGNTNVSLPNTATWVATGNNPTLDRELARRTISCRIDARYERPECREGFKHPRLLQWVSANRAELVHAALTLIQAWVAAGRPEGNQGIGSFECWSRTLGGILDVVGIRGFLADRAEMLEESSDDTASLRHFVDFWIADLGVDTPRTPGELTSFCEKHELLVAERGDGNERAQATKMGWFLKRNRDRVVGGYRLRLVRDGGRKRGRLFQLEPVGDDPTAAEPLSGDGSSGELFPEPQEPDDGPTGYY